LITTETTFSATTDTVTRIDIGGNAGAGVSPNGHDFFNLTGNVSFAGTNVADSFNLTKGGTVDASVTLATQVDFLVVNFTGTETLRIQDGNLFDSTDPDVTDNCASANGLRIEQDPPPGTPVGGGAHPIRITATDPRGNADSPFRVDSTGSQQFFRVRYE